MNGKWLSNLRFGDDIVLFAKGMEQLREMMKRLLTLCEEVGLYPNYQKKKLMTNGIKEECEINNHKNTGTKRIQEDTKDLLERRESANIDCSLFYSPQATAKDCKYQQLPQTANTNSVSRFLPNTYKVNYATETWTLNPGVYSKLQAAEMDFWRRYLRITLLDRVRNEHIKSRGYQRSSGEDRKEENAMSMVFHVSEHPHYPGFKQCVSFNVFEPALETAYNLFCVSAMYFIPLMVIIFAYTCIMWEISKKSRETRADETDNDRVRGRMRLRRSDMSNIERARSRTLRMTITIVAAFIWCWTPYVVMTLWYMFDRETATKVDTRIQDALFLMAVSNSCMNPLVYGSYAMNFRRECQTCFCYLFNSNQHLQRRSTGSGRTRSSTVAAFGNLNHNRNQLTINRRNLRPVSAEQLMTRDRNDSEEFHSDPGAAHGVYLVTS
nr:uncharacterized protein LOC106688967 [Halyomorpha halys]